MAIHNVPFLNARVVNCFPRPHAIKIDMSTQFITRNLNFLRLANTENAQYVDFDFRHDYLKYAYTRKN